MQKLLSEEAEIFKNGRRAIYDIKESDNYDIERYRRKHEYDVIPSQFDMLEGDGNDVKHDYMVCMYIADGNIARADVIWRTMDIVELFEKQAYKLVYEYKPLDLPKD